MIREIGKEDKEIFISMVGEFYNSEAVLHTIPIENMIATYHEIISVSPYIKAYIIKDKEKRVGYGLIGLTYSNEAGGLVVWIEELYIRKEYRGLGLGGSFLDFIKEEFSSSAKRFRLEIAPENQDVKALYLRKGYTALEYNQMVYDPSHT